ncbi:hypothetical protein BGZ49_005457 [Haplosporangium sp. Z 27]|nr:hypothetical protein BGZ49_005457 [Haplosporangium sp. Z 27]
MARMIAVYIAFTPKFCPSGNVVSALAELGIFGLEVGEVVAVVDDEVDVFVTVVAYGEGEYSERNDPEHWHSARVALETDDADGWLIDPRIAWHEALEKAGLHEVQAAELVGNWTWAPDPDED